MVEFHLGALIADATRYESMSRRFRPGGNSIEISEVALWLFLLAGIVTAVWLSHKLAGHVIRSTHHSLSRLFHDLCAAHGVNWWQRRLLHQLARACNLPHPVHLFLRPACFDSRNLPANLAGHQRQFAALQESLFGGGDERGL
jgi:hypothetical protein